MNSSRKRSLIPPFPGFPSKGMLSGAVAAFRQKPDFTFTRLDSALVDMAGIGSHSWGKRPEDFWELVHEEDRDWLRGRLADWPEKPAWATSQFRIRHRQTGQVRYLLEWRRLRFRARKQPSLWEGFWVDRTDAERSVRRLAAAAGKEVLAQFTAGYAHDLNNVLTGIGSLTELCLLEAKGVPQFEQHLAMLKESVGRAGRLIDDLGRLVSQNRRRKLHRDLSDLGQEVIRWLRPVVPRRITLDGHWADLPLPVFVEELECRQVLFDLILNSAAAMPGSGRILLQASVQDQFCPGQVMTGMVPTGRAACLAVTDTGWGIDPGQREGVFDLSYSTRAGSCGIGFGLARARQFVLAHRGAVTLESTPGQGSTFQLWLPLSDFSEVGAGGEETDLKFLVAGPSGPRVEAMLSGLKSCGWRMIRALREPEQTLISGEDAFVAAIVDIDAQAPVSVGFVQFVRRQRVPVKLIMVAHPTPKGALESLLAQADLVLEPGESLEVMLEKIRACVNPNGPV